MEGSLAKLTAADLPPEFLRRVADDVNMMTPVLVSAFERALPTLQLIADSVQRLERAPPVSGYQEYLTADEDHPLVAKAMVYNVGRLGEERLTLGEAGRVVSSAVRAVLQAKGASALVFSRRVRKLQIALADAVQMTAFERACEKAGAVNAIYAIKPALDAVVQRKSAGRDALIAICQTIRPHLRDPRGRKQRLISATHEVFLEVADRAFTNDLVEDDFSDPATRATRLSFGDPDFNPVSARRRLRKKK
jgi:hypothetical protein